MNELLGWHVLVILLLLLWLVPVVGIVAFVASFFLAPIGVLFGHVVLHQIRKSTDRGSRRPDRRALLV
jgi:hypothetical protein